MPAYDRFELRLGPPTLLRLGSALLHAALLALLARYLWLGLEPSAALGWAMVAVLGLGWREDHRLRSPARYLRVAGEEIFDVERRTTARIVRVSCAVRWCAMARLRGDGGRSEWLLVGPGQLDAASMRRLLRFLRAAEGR